MTKEDVYDTTIAPLMEQIITACKANGIAMLATFSIPTDNDPDLCCTTMIPDESGESGPNHQRALRIINGTVNHAMTITAERADGSKQIMAVLS